jgi:glycosyltransferase involved in cell wall biosynthesis
MHDRDWRMHVVTTDMFAGNDDRAWIDAYREAYPIDVFASKGPGSFGYSAELRARLDGLVARGRLMHLHTVWTYPGLAAARACRRHGVPYVVMPHGMLDPSSIGRKWWKKQLYGRAIEWRNLRRAAAMIYTHEEERRLAEAVVSGLPPGNIVPLGADDPPDVPRETLAAEFFAVHPQLAGRPLVVFLSRLHAKKGLDLLIPAMQQVIAASPQAHLVLIGQGDPGYESHLRRLAERCHVSNHITWTGTLSGRAKWAALAAGRVLALSSYQENFALVIVEALRMGLPVVLTRRVNICDDVVQAGAGLECSLDPASVAEQLGHYLGDATRAEQDGDRGRLLVGERFTWHAAAEAMLNVYESILPSTPRPQTAAVAAVHPES